MKLRLIALTTLLALLCAFIVAPQPTRAASPAATSGLTQTLTNVPVGTSATSAPVGTFTGTMTVTHFANQHGTLVAQGTLHGVETLANGTTQAIDTPFAAPVTAATGSCTILDLTLGPLNLNLLGLVVQTNTIHLTITAQQGPGNLLGNLLCAVANLLNGSAPLGALSGLLNQILAILGTL